MFFVSICVSLKRVHAVAIYMMHVADVKEHLSSD